MVLTLSPRRTTQVLSAVVAFLVLAGAAGELSRALPERDAPLARALRLLRWAFRPSGEQTVSAWYAAAALLLAALLLLAVAAATRAAGRPFVGHWQALGLLFLFLSCDEAVGIHEALGDRIGEVVPTGGFLLWAWVVPYAALTLAVALACVPFLRHLPAETRRRFLAAGVLFVGGALVLESVQARLVDGFGHGTLAVAVLASAEEALEMVGVVVFVHALLAYAAAHAPVRLEVAAASARLPARQTATTDGPASSPAGRRPAASEG